jgi:hypothetical protein
MAVAADVLAVVDAGRRPPSSVRDAGQPPYSHRVPEGSTIDETVGSVVGQAWASIGDGKLAVICPPARYDGVVAEVTRRLPSTARTGADGLDAAVAVLDVTEAKGLEFDAVVLVEPVEWVAGGSRGLRDLYVALTRTTQRLDVVHTGALPDVLAGLVPWSAAA